MAGTIVADIIQSDQSYPSSINIASPMIVSNTITMGSSAAISGNVNFDSNLLFVDAVNNKVGIKTQNPSGELDARIGDIRFGDGTANVSVRLTGPNNWDFFKNNTTDVLSIRRNSISRFDISASGHVTIPNQPCASAYRSLGGTTSAGTYEMVYDAVQVNVGSYYNSSTGRFTCPVAGTYRVTAFGMGQLVSPETNFFVTVRKNGSGTGGTAYNYGSSTDYKHASGNWLVTCAANDFLSIYAGGGGGYYGDGYAGVTFELIG
jgi:hypothetical protein